MTADPGHRGPPLGPPISDRAARRIAGAFGVLLADVLLDARHVASWTGSADDLLVWLEDRYLWQAQVALAYLLHRRVALRHPARDDPAG